MGFFGMFNYEKPGRGVDKDMPEKRGAFAFFDIFFRKFWRVVSLSFSYTLLCVPVFMLYFFLTTFSIQTFCSGSDPALVTWLGLYVTLFLLSFGCGGPMSAGQAYVLRNFSRDHHSWVWEDFWTTTKENCKQGLGVLVLDVVLLSVLSSAAFLYFSSAEALPIPPMLSTVFGFFAVFAFFIYLMMHFFIYPLMVTFDMKLGTILKTALQLTMMHLPGCVLMLITSSILFAVVLVFFYINVAFILLFAALGFSLTTFSYTFYATRVIDAVLEKQS